MSHRQAADRRDTDATRRCHSPGLMTRGICLRPMEGVHGRNASAGRRCHATLLRALEGQLFALQPALEELAGALGHLNSPVLKRVQLHGDPAVVVARAAQRPEERIEVNGAVARHEVKVHPV